MKKIPTSEELIEQKHGDQLGLFTRKDLYSLMIEFAKLHVEQALEEASENAEQKWVKYTDNDYEIDKDSILNAYSLTNIK